MKEDVKAAIKNKIIQNLENEEVNVTEYKLVIKMVHMGMYTQAMKRNKKVFIVSFSCNNCTVFFRLYNKHGI